MPAESNELAIPAAIPKRSASSNTTPINPNGKTTRSSLPRRAQLRMNAAAAERATPTSGCNLKQRSRVSIGNNGLSATDIGMNPESHRKIRKFRANSRQQRSREQPREIAPQLWNLLA